jgi:hypothetical protein
VLGWQLSLAVPLAVVGLLTLRAGWLGLHGRLGNVVRPAAATGQTAAFTAGARVAAPPLLTAGAVAVLGAAAAAAQPTPASMITVAVVVWAGALGLALAARSLAHRAAHAVTQAAGTTTQAGAAAQAGTTQAHCAGCPLTASCARHPWDEWTAGPAACPAGEGHGPRDPHQAGP